MGSNLFSAWARKYEPIRHVRQHYFRASALFSSSPVSIAATRWRHNYRKICISVEQPSNVQHGAFPSREWTAPPYSHALQQKYYTAGNSSKRLRQITASVNLTISMLYVFQTHTAHIQTDLCCLYELEIQAYKAHIKQLFYVCFICLHDSSAYIQHTGLYVASGT